MVAISIYSPGSAVSDGIVVVECRHQALMRVYQSTRSVDREAAASTGGASAMDLELLRQDFQFIRDEDEDAERGETDWRVRMSVRYYRKLFREYALADLSRFREGKLGLRWRTEREVVAGKGQFSCGNKRCDVAERLHSYEVLFAYVEHGEKKRCLVKLRVCEQCARKLFFKKLQQRASEEQARGKRKRERKSSRIRSSKRRVSESESSSNSDKGDNDADDSIHQVCTRINDEEKERYRSNERRGDQGREDSMLKTLLP